MVFDCYCLNYWYTKQCWRVIGPITFSTPLWDFPISFWLYKPNFGFSASTIIFIWYTGINYFSSRCPLYTKYLAFKYHFIFQLQYLVIIRIYEIVDILCLCIQISLSHSITFSYDIFFCSVAALLLFLYIYSAFPINIQSLFQIHREDVSSWITA